MVETSCHQDKIVFDPERGEYICTETGEVLEDKIVDLGPERKAYTEEEKIERSRAEKIKTTVHDLGLATDIDLKAKDRRKAIKLKRMQMKSRLDGADNRNLTKAMMTLKRIAGQLGLPDFVQEEASRIYRKALEKISMKGKKIEQIVAACIRIACKNANVHITYKELEAVQISKEDIRRGMKFLFRYGITKSGTPTDLKKLIDKYSDKLDLSQETKTYALELAEKVKELELTSGKDPISVAAAIIYIASNVKGERRSQREIAETTGVSDVTIRKRYKEIATKLGIDRENIVSGYILNNFMHTSSLTF